MGNDVIYWREFGRSLGIKVLARVEIELAGFRARLTALLPRLGAPNGMLVDANWDAIAPHKSAILDAGYGFSCVGAVDPMILRKALLPEHCWAIGVKPMPRQSQIGSIPNARNGWVRTSAGLFRCYCERLSKVLEPCSAAMSPKAKDRVFE